MIHQQHSLLPINNLHTSLGQGGRIGTRMIRIYRQRRRRTRGLRRVSIRTILMRGIMIR